MADKQDKDDEIGLSESELNEIMDKENIFELANQKQKEEQVGIDNTNLSIFDEAEDSSSKLKKGQINTDSLDGLLDDIDSLGTMEDSETSIVLDDDVDILPGGGATEENVLNDGGVDETASLDELDELKDGKDNNLETIDLSELSLDGITEPPARSENTKAVDLENTKAANLAADSKNEDKPLRFTISTTTSKSKKKTKKPSSSPTSKPRASVMKKTTSTKPSPAKKTVTKKPVVNKAPTAKLANNTVQSAQSVQLNSRLNNVPVADVWKDEVLLQKLFMHLDEMLATASKDQIKRFALSAEYDLYLAILKKLNI